MHLSPEYGLTYEQIEEDGFKINKKIEMLVSSNMSISISKSMGLGHVVLNWYDNYGGSGTSCGNAIR